jgi:hypothetical protein
MHGLRPLLQCQPFAGASQSQRQIGVLKEHEKARIEQPAGRFNRGAAQ